MNIKTLKLATSLDHILHPLACRDKNTLDKQESLTKRIIGIAIFVFAVLLIIPAIIYYKLADLKINAIQKAATSIATDSENPVDRPKKILLDSKSKIDQTLITFPYLEISRLGDYAKFYLNAKWAAYKLGVPIVIRPFPESEKLTISEKYKYQLDQSAKKNNFKRLTVQQMQDISDGKLTKEDLGPGIFTVPFFWEWTLSPSTTPNWQNNMQFRSDYNHDFNPASNLKTDLVLPIDGKINIAIQIRDGGEFDNLTDKFLYPARFPDFSYYDAQLEYVLKLPEHVGKPIHIQIFTDAIYPSKLKERLEKIAQNCGAENATIAFRPNHCSADEAIINDLISLTKFPIVIRAKSGFSDLSVFIGLPGLEIYPDHAALTAEGVSYVDKVRVIRRNPVEQTVDIFTGSSKIIEGTIYSKKWPENQEKEFKQVWESYTGKK